MIRSVFNKLFPHPFLTLALWIIWLLLNNTIDAGHIVLGFIIATLIPFITSGFWPEKVRIKAPLVLIKFLLIVLWDIIVSNLVVAKLILGRNNQLKPAFFYIDLDIQTALGIGVLANTISLTPGTVSCDWSSEHNRLLVHALNVDNIDETIKLIKQRYEAPLIQVFSPC